MNFMNFVKKLPGFILTSIICFLPAGLYLFSRYWPVTSGFWQNFSLAALAAYIIVGSIQIFLLLLWIGAVFHYWVPEKNCS